MFLPMISRDSASMSLWDARAVGAAGQVYLVLGSFIAAAAMGGMGIAKGLQRWMSIVATLAFAFVLFKFRDGLFDLFKGAIGAKLIGLGAWGGLIVSAITIAKPAPAKS